MNRSFLSLHRFDLRARRLGALALLLPLALAAQTLQGRDDTTASTIDGRTRVAPATGTTDAAQQPSGPVRLRQGSAVDPRQDAGRRPERPGTAPRGLRPDAEALSEFEDYVQRLAAPVEVRRFGAELVRDPSLEPDAAEHDPLVPPDYLLKPGDQIQLTLWGSVDADLRLTIDRSGRISVPRVGAIMLSGVRYADLSDVIAGRVGLVFKNFQLSTSLAQLRGIRVYVTGFVARPGAYTVSALSTMAGALLRAGGPSMAGSFRTIQLRRGRDVLGSFDLYDLLLKGDRSADRLVQADDVIHVGAVGPQVALIGSVNRPAIFELKRGETVDDLLRMAGGFAPVADATRLTLERLDERSSVRVKQLALPDGQASELHNGDVLRAFNAVNVALPAQRQNKRVRIEGEVLRPGDYVLPPESSLRDALRAAGGLTDGAFLFGSEFSRESVRLTQQENYERALRDLETELARSASAQRIASSEEATASAARASASNRLVERLRAVRPTGRVVLQMTPDGRELPDLALEDGDRLYVPPRPTSVGVFGSVFNTGSYLYTARRTIDDYLRLAGGPTRGADQGSVFVIRANGTVVSNLQNSSWWRGSRGDFETLRAEPGDTIFVPEELNKITFVQGAKDWTQILYQLGLGVAAIWTIGR